MASIGEETAESQRKFEEKVREVARESGVGAEKILPLLGAFHANEETNKVLGMLLYAQTCDLCFVFDTTGSMTPAFDCLKSNIKGILSGIKALNPHIQVRIGLVAYRDPEDGDKHLTIHVLPLQKSITAFSNKAKEIVCGGGGDECEDVIAGLEAASKFDWITPVPGTDPVEYFSHSQNRLIFMCGGKWVGGWVKKRKNYSIII